MYAFSSAEDPADDIRCRAACALQIKEYELPFAETLCTATIVRDVAPKKLMVCLSFVLPDQCATAPPLSRSVLKLDEQGCKVGRADL